MVFVLAFIALAAFFCGSVMYFRFSKQNQRNVQTPSISFHFFDAIFLD